MNWKWVFEEVQRQLHSSTVLHFTAHLQNRCEYGCTECVWYIIWFCQRGGWCCSGWLTSETAALMRPLPTQCCIAASWFLKPAQHQHRCKIGVQLRRLLIYLCVFKQLCWKFEFGMFIFAVGSTISVELVANERLLEPDLYSERSEPAHTCEPEPLCCDRVCVSAPSGRGKCRVQKQHTCKRKEVRCK